MLGDADITLSISLTACGWGGFHAAKARWSSCRHRRGEAALTVAPGRRGVLIDRPNGGSPGPGDPRRGRARLAIRRRLSAVRLPVFVRDASSYSGVSLFSQLSALLYNIVLRGILAPAVMGFYDFVAVVQNVASNFDPGISAAAAIQLPGLKGAGKDEQSTIVRSTALWGEIAQGFLMAAGIGIYVLVGGVSGELAVAALVGAVIVVFFAAQDSLTTIHQGNQSFVALSGALLAAALLAALLLPGSALIGGLHGLFIGAIALAAARVLFLYIAARRAGIGFVRRFDWPSFRSLIGLGFPLRVVDFPQAIIGSLDLILVTSLLGIKALAIYSFARLVFLQGANLPSLIGTVFIMRAFRLSGANVSRAELAKDSREFLLLEYLVVMPLLICLVVQAFGFLTATVLSKYTDSVSVLSFLMFATFFVPQTTVIRNFWMLDRRFAALGVSNLFGLLTHGIGLGLAIWIQGLTVSSIALGTLIGWSGYYVWIIGTVGRELWGKRTAAGVGAHAALGAAVTGFVVWLVPAVAGGGGAVNALGATAGHVALSFLMLTPLVAYGVWRTGALRHFRHPEPDDQAAGES